MRLCCRAALAVSALGAASACMDGSKANPQPDPVPEPPTRLEITDHPDLAGSFVELAEPGELVGELRLEIDDTSAQPGLIGAILDARPRGTVFGVPNRFALRYADASVPPGSSEDDFRLVRIQDDDRIVFYPLQIRSTADNRIESETQVLGRFAIIDPAAAGFGRPPVAAVGPDVTARTQDTITLDGSDSLSRSGERLSYLWTLSSRPEASQAFIDAARTARPTLFLDTPGDYEASLQVYTLGVPSDTRTTRISTVNSAPDIDAGPDQSTPLFRRVFLDASATVDVDGDPLSFNWTLLSRPAGSDAELDDATALRPSFFVDEPGSYRARLEVSDGTLAGEPDEVLVSTENLPPVANPGPDQRAALGDAVALDGSASFDPDGDAIDFRWEFVVVPAGSNAFLRDFFSARPSFDVDVAGLYVVQLVVIDELFQESFATVAISTETSPPTARAGADVSGFVGDRLTFDGGASTDPEGDPLDYAWTLSRVPENSGGLLFAEFTRTPTLEIDAPGEYLLQLVVNDGQLTSQPDTLVVSTLNSRPVANAGPDFSAERDTVVRIDGTGSSDADNDELTFRWTLLSQVEGAEVTLDLADRPLPALRADLAGEYLIQLVVSDGQLDSEPDTVIVTFVEPGAGR